MDPRLGVAIFVIYYGSWAVIVSAAPQGADAIGPAFAAMVIALAARWTEVPRRRFSMFVAGFTLAGTVFDAILLNLGGVGFANPCPIPYLAPLWMMSLWALFAATFPLSMRWLFGRPVAGFIGGLIFAPLSYVACERMGALTLYDPWVTLPALGVVWGGALAFIAHRAPVWLR